ncbi:MAG: hypothetical protein AAFV59_18690, partial [Pseudomonadota bacterium]
VGLMGDTVWVADIHAIRGYDRKTGEIIDTQRNIVGVGELGGSINLSVDGDALILTSWFDGDVRVWDPKTQQRLAHYPNLLGPVAAIRYGDGIAISEHFKGTVTLLGDGDPVVLASGLPAAGGLQVYAGALYVSDRTLGEIQIIARDGIALETPEVVASDLDGPEGFLVTETAIVVVEAETGRVTKIEANGDRHELAAIPAGAPG